MEEALIKRIMPNSLEAEQSVIGSMIMDKDAIVTAMEMLISEDFYHQQYGVLFDTMIELYNKGLPVDLVTLQNKLKEKDVPPEIASLEFVRDLVTAVPTSANVKYYAQIVKDNAMRRKLIKLNEEIENECYLGKESVETVMDITEKKVFDLLSARGGGGDYGKAPKENFGGGAGAGVKIDPVAFLVIKDGITRVMPVSVPPASTLERVVDMVPDIMDKVEKYIDKKQAKETLE